MMTIIKLGDVAVEAKSTNKGDKTGCKIVGLEHLTPSDVTLSAWSDDTNNSFTKEFSKGDVLFGRRRAYLKKAAVAPFDGICSGDITVIRAKEGKVNPQLLPFIIQNDYLFDFAVGKSAGSLSPRVKWEHLKNFEIMLPDMATQKQLADTLWSINETKQAYLALIKQTDELVKSQFIELFDGKYQEQKLDDLSAQWFKGQPLKKDDIKESGQNKCIHYGELFTKYGPVIDEIYSLTDIEIAEKKRSRCGDILFPASDVTPTGLARCSALFEDDVILGGDIIVLRPKRGINAAFLSYAINQQKEQLMSRVTGSLVRHMSSKSLESVLIPVPPIELQNDFVLFAGQSDKSRFELQDAIDNLDALSKKIIAENLIAAGKE